MQHYLQYLGEGNGTHSRTLAWKIPWTEKPGRPQSMGSLRVGHDCLQAPLSMGILQARTLEWVAISFSHA